MTLNSHHKSTKGKLHLTNLLTFYEASVDGGGGGEKALEDIYFDFSGVFDKASSQPNWGKLDWMCELQGG